MKTFKKNLKKFTLFLFMILLLTNCKKDALVQPGSISEYAIQNNKQVNAHISYTAKEESYSTYQNPINTDPENSGKYLNTLPKTNTYDLVLDITPNGMNMVIDNMDFKSPVEDWNDKTDKAKKIVNDGNYCTAYDYNGKKIFSQEANLSKPSPRDIYESFSVMIDKRSISEKMKDLQSKGAKLIESSSLYAVKTSFNNANFMKNSVSIFMKDDARMACYTEYEDAGAERITIRRFMHYDAVGNPKEIYTESFSYLPDGDIQKTVTIINFSRVNISLN